jgi:hypothetical protein
MQENNGRAFNPPVIVRAWGDEPVKVFLYAIENNRCIVGASDGVRTLSLPADQVFYFDVDRLTSLSTAFQQGDRRKLGELWAKIPVDDFACNRYQDKLECLHDQEPISSVGSAQECGGQ